MHYVSSVCSFRQTAVCAHLSFVAKKSGVNQVSFVCSCHLEKQLYSHFIHRNDLLSTGTQLFNMYDISFYFSNNFKTTTTFPLF